MGCLYISAMDLCLCNVCKSGPKAQAWLVKLFGLSDQTWAQYPFMSCINAKLPIALVFFHDCMIYARCVLNKVLKIAPYGVASEYASNFASVYKLLL